MHTIRVVIAEGRTLFRQGLAALLRAEPDFEIVGEAANAEEARRVCTRLVPDLILLDASLPETGEPDGQEIITTLRACCPQAALFVIGEAGLSSPGHPLTDQQAEEAAEREKRHALHLGATTCLHSTMDFMALYHALLTLHTQRLASHQQTETLSATAPTAYSSHRTLSERETEILTLISQGLCNKEIAHRLGIQTQTVKNHVSHLLEKLELADRLQLAVYKLEEKREKA